MRVKGKTKVVFLTELKDIVANALGNEKAGEYLAFLDNELEQIRRKREAQKEKQEQRKIENDEIARAILDMLTDEPVTNTDILEEPAYYFVILYPHYYTTE